MDTTHAHTRSIKHVALVHTRKQEHSGRETLGRWPATQVRVLSAILQRGAHRQNVQQFGVRGVVLPTGDGDRILCDVCKGRK